MRPMEAEYPFHTASLLLLLGIGCVRMYYRGFADAASGVRESSKNEGVFQWIRILIGGPIAVVAAVYILWPPWAAWAQFSLAPESRWLGVGLGFASLGLMIWLHRHLSRNFTGTVQIRPGGHVVKTGPYAVVRHPMYVAFLLLAIGLLLQTANWFIGGGFLLTTILVIVIRTPLEERKLLEAYGEEYRKYKEKTGGLFPRLPR